MVEALEPCKKSLERLELDFGLRHESDPCFRSLPSMKSFTSLKTLYLTQGAIGNHEWADDVPEDAFTKLLTSSIEELRIRKFLDAYKYAVLNFAEQTAAGAYPNLEHVRLIGWEEEDDDDDESGWLGVIYGKAFLTFASGQDVSQLPVKNIETNIVGIDLDNEVSTHQLLFGEEREEEAEDQEASEETGSEAGSFGLTHHYDWVRFGRRCLEDNDFKSQIARCVKEKSVIFLTTALQYLPLRQKIQRLFSEKYVVLECVTVEVLGDGKIIQVAYF